VRILFRTLPFIAFAGVLAVMAVPRGDVLMAEAEVDRIVWPADTMDCGETPVMLQVAGGCPGILVAVPATASPHATCDDEWSFARIGHLGHAIPVHFAPAERALVLGAGPLR
jgi:hypothetical protein